MQPASEVHPADESVEVAMPRDAKCVADSPEPDADTGTTGRAASPPATAEEQRQHREVMVAIAVLTVCGMAYQTANGACLPLYAKYAERLGLGESAGGLVIAAPSVARVILNLRLGKLADDLGRKELLVGGSLIMAIGAYCTAAASSLWMMLLARLLMGAGGAASDIAAQACRLDVVARFPARRGMLLGAAQSLTMLAYAAGPVVGGRLALHGGVHVPFNVLGVVLCVCAPLYGFLPKTQAATARPTAAGGVHADDALEASTPLPSTPTRELLRDPRQRGLLLLRFALTAGWSAWMTVLPVHLSHRFGLDTAQLGFYFSLMTLLGFAASPVGGLVSDRLGRHAVARVGAVLSAVSLGCLPATSTLAGFWSLMAVWEVSEASMNAATTAASADITRVELRGVQSSLLSQVQDATFVVMPTALGALSSWLGTDVALVLTASLQLCAIAGFAALMRLGGNLPLPLSLGMGRAAKRESDE